MGARVRPGVGRRGDNGGAAGRPLGAGGDIVSQLGLMGIRADKSAVGAVNRPLQSYYPHPRATIKALPSSLHPPSPLRETPTILSLMGIRADKLEVAR